MKRVRAIALLILVGFGAGLTSHAQFGLEPLTLTLAPEYPRPFQTVTVVPESSTIDLAASKVTTLVNGAVVSEGSGAEPAYVTLGAPGTVTTITVRATSGAQTYTRTLTVRPADVALIVEPQSTAHPFYEGGTLVASEGAIRVIAIPDLRNSSGAAIPANSLVYTWRNGEQILQSASGIGKSVLTATAPVLHRDARISVTVTTPDRALVAQMTTVLSPSEPLVRVYRNDPLLGPLYGTALPSRVTLAGEEETFRVVPYFFRQTPAFVWEVNNTPSDTNRDITVRSSGTGRGRAALEVAAATPGGIESADTAVTVDFGNDDGFSFFGL